MAIDRVSMPPAVRAAIERASAATGADFGMLMETARRESSFNPSARAPTSSARGLFQFIEGTWLDMVRRYGAKHGLGDLAARADDPAARREILNLRYDPEFSARMAGELARENAATLSAKLGRVVSGGEVYAAHVMGPAGAARLIAAAERGAPDASALFPREAAANPWLFNENGAPRSARALLAKLDVAADSVVAASAETPSGRLEIARADGPALAAFIAAMFETLARDLLAPPALTQDREASDPLRAAAAYAKLQDKS